MGAVLSFANRGKRMSAPLNVVVTGQSLIHFDLRPLSAHLDPIVSLLKAGDVAFTNFESTIFGQHRGWPLKGSYFGCSPPDVLSTLSGLGLNALALANNHAFDLGPSGVLSTLEEVRSRPFLHSGIGVDRTDANRIAEQRFAGQTIGLLALDAGPGPAWMYADDRTGDRPARPGVNSLKVSRSFDIEGKAFDLLTSLQTQLGTTALEHANYAQPNDPLLIDGVDEMDFYGVRMLRAERTSRRITVDPADLDAKILQIREAARRGVFVIVYLHHHHWDADWQNVPAWVEAFAHDCVDAGAMMFVSHGAPVLQGIEIYKGSPIFYGLGNFIFHTERSETTWSPAEVWRSVVASCAFDKFRKLQEVRLTPIIVDGSNMFEQRLSGKLSFPTVANEADADEILADLTYRSAKFGTEIEAKSGVATIMSFASKL